jgi:hypothetical protein
MRPAPILAALAVLSLTAACSRYDNDKAGADVKDAGRSVDNAASKAAHSPDVKSVEADFKKAGHTASTDFHKLAADAKAAAHKLAAQTRAATHDVTHHADDRS